MTEHSKTTRIPVLVAFRSNNRLAARSPNISNDYSSNRSNPPSSAHSIQSASFTEKDDESAAIPAGQLKRSKSGLPLPVAGTTSSTVASSTTSSIIICDDTSTSKKKANASSRQRRRGSETNCQTSSKSQFGASIAGNTAAAKRNVQRGFATRTPSGSQSARDTAAHTHSAVIRKSNITDQNAASNAISPRQPSKASSRLGQSATANNNGSARANSTPYPTKANQIKGEMRGVASGRNRGAQQNDASSGGRMRRDGMKSVATNRKPPSEMNEEKENNNSAFSALHIEPIEFPSSLLESYSQHMRELPPSNNDNRYDVIAISDLPTPCNTVAQHTQQTAAGGVGGGADKAGRRFGSSLRRERLQTVGKSLRNKLASLSTNKNGVEIESAGMIASRGGNTTAQRPLPTSAHSTSQQHTQSSTPPPLCSASVMAQLSQTELAALGQELSSIKLNLLKLKRLLIEDDSQHLPFFPNALAGQSEGAHTHAPITAQNRSSLDEAELLCADSA